MSTIKRYPDILKPLVEGGIIGDEQLAFVYERNDDPDERLLDAVRLAAANAAFLSGLPDALKTLDKLMVYHKCLREAGAAKVQRKADANNKAGSKKRLGRPKDEEVEEPSFDDLL
jgi:hypothetical protein